MSDLDTTTAERALRTAVEAYGLVWHDARGAAIPGAALRDVLLRATEKPRKLVVHGAKVTGEFCLEAGAVAFPVKFEDCEFDEAPNLEQTRFPGLYLVRCRLPGLHGTQLGAETNLVLRDCEVAGTVELTGAAIKGQLWLTGSRLRALGGAALKADGIVVGQDLLFDRGFRAEGRVRMVGARLGGQLICTEAAFRDPGGVALELDGAIVTEDTFWSSGFLAEGVVSVCCAKLEGKLDCSGGTFRNPGRVALSAEGLRVQGDVLFAGGAVEGGANLTGCAVGGRLDLTGGRFSDPGRTALDLARAHVAQNLVCRSGFVAQGLVLLAGAEIGGGLWCEGGHFDNGTDTALDATGVIVHRDVRLGRIPESDSGFHAQGGVVLSGATVAGDFDCTGGDFANPDRVSLVAKGMSVKRDVTMRTGFVAGGSVDLTGTKVDGSLDCGGGVFGNSGRAFCGDHVEVGQSAVFDRARAAGQIRLCGARIANRLTFARTTISGDEKALLLNGAVVGGQLRLVFPTKPAGGIHLCQVRAAYLDDRESRWPDRVKLYEFVYGALPNDGVDVKSRLQWLGRHHKYAPQVYTQLARTYELSGMHDSAKRVLMAAEDARRASRQGVSRRLVIAFDWLLKYTVGYGYRPLWVLYWFFGLLVLGWRLFSHIGESGFHHAKTGESATHQPFLYTLDLLLPVVSLRQRDLWVVEGAALWWSTAFTVLGWVLAICLVTGLGKAFKREL
ncbi:hypothetical protein ABZ816_40555 [Actinosynnema sp. NPDC047251]|uniref:Putative membrane protein n=1 Tax=Saccharothrix espanaensis (strain ATCC 51144 / DSM 44229 / JCM 9112 / NBRC 15066 / NRRL 15764) TaxID=1179773 RepID=K0JV53_SACES|nr:hypothetical protein [Saccharothrix espanaensis]CCH29871.1 putative membrane protein [Saccharothrix espanaensis DSM 44229]